MAPGADGTDLTAERIRLPAWGGLPQRAQRLLLQASSLGNDCRSVRSLLNRNRNRNRNRDRVNRVNRVNRGESCSEGQLALMDRSNFTAEFFNTAIIQLRFPLSQDRIPSRVLSIPRPIATPTPILLLHWPFRIAPSSRPSEKAIGSQRKVSGSGWGGTPAEIAEE